MAKVTTDSFPPIRGGASKDKDDEDDDFGSFEDAEREDATRSEAKEDGDGNVDDDEKKKTNGSSVDPDVSTRHKDEGAGGIADNTAGVENLASDNALSSEKGKGEEAAEAASVVKTSASVVGVSAADYDDPFAELDGVGGGEVGIFDPSLHVRDCEEEKETADHSNNIGDRVDGLDTFDDAVVVESPDGDKKDVIPEDEKEAKEQEVKTPPPIEKENEGGQDDDDDDDEFGEFGAFEGNGNDCPRNVNDGGGGDNNNNNNDDEFGDFADLGAVTPSLEVDAATSSNMKMEQSQADQVASPSAAMDGDKPEREDGDEEGKFVSSDDTNGEGGADGDRDNEDDDDEFGDFGDFDDAPASSNAAVTGGDVEGPKKEQEVHDALPTETRDEAGGEDVKNNDDDDGDDEFGDFGDFDEAVAPASGAEAATASAEAPFVDAEETRQAQSVPIPASTAGDDDDFGNFGDFGSSSPVTEAEVVEQKTASEDPFVAKARTILERVFGGFSIDNAAATSSSSYSGSSKATDEGGAITLERLLSSIDDAESTKRSKAEEEKNDDDDDGGEDSWSKRQLDAILADLRDLPAASPSIISNHDVPRPYAHYEMPTGGIIMSEDGSIRLSVDWPGSGGRGGGGGGGGGPVVPDVLSIRLPSGPESPPPLVRPPSAAARAAIALPEVRVVGGWAKEKGDEGGRGRSVSAANSSSSSTSTLTRGKGEADAAAVELGEMDDARPSLGTDPRGGSVSARDAAGGAGGSDADFDADFGGFESAPKSVAAAAAAGGAVAVPSFAPATAAEGGMSAACKEFLRQIPDLSFMLKSTLALPPESQNV